MRDSPLAWAGLGVGVGDADGDGDGEADGVGVGVGVDVGVGVLALVGGCCGSIPVMLIVWWLVEVNVPSPDGLMASTGLLTPV